MNDRVPDSLYEIHRSIGRVEGKLDALMQTVISNNDNHSKNDKDMDGRLRRVEHHQWWHSGAASVFGAIGGYLLTTIKSTFGV